MNEKISTLRQERHVLKEEFKLLAEKDIYTDEDTQRMSDVEKSVGEKDVRIARLEALSEMEAKSASPVDDGVKSFDKAVVVRGEEMGSNVVLKMGRDKRETKGTRFGRFLFGELYSKLAKNHNAGPNLLRHTFNDKEVADELYEAQRIGSFDYNNFDKSMHEKAQNSTLTQAAGGALIPQDFHAELIDLLYSNTVVRGSGVPVYQTGYGNTSWPRLNGGATAYWGAEETDIPVSNITFDDIQTNVKKLFAMVPVSNDLIRRSPLSVPDIIKTNMARMMGYAEDKAFLWGMASSAQDPILGIYGQTLAANKFNVTSVPAGDATDLRMVNDVLNTLELALLNENVPMNNTNFLFAPQIKAFLSTLTDQVGRYFFRDELDAGNLYGHPFKMSTQFPTNLSAAGLTGTTATTTALSTASTTMTLPTTGILPGMYLTGTGLTGTVVVVTITDSTHLVVNAPVTIASGVVVTSRPATAAMFGLVAWDNYFICDTMNMFADSSTEASYIDAGAVMRSTYSRDQSVFRTIKEMDLGCFHPQGASFATVPGWAPTAYTSFSSYGPGAPYITQPAVTTPSSAGSANPV